MKKLSLIAGILGVIGVFMGALGAHALKEGLAASGHTQAWETAVLYHLIHTVALYAFSAQAAGHGPRSPATGWAWVAGIVLFSGSLYVLALGGPTWLGPVTPVGGLAFIVGWGLVIRQALTSKKLA